LRADRPSEAKVGRYCALWGWHTRSDKLLLICESPGPQTFDFPHIVTTRGRRNTVVVCEDDVGDDFMRGLTHSEQSSTSP
jgi:uncharacterized protein